MPWGGETLPRSCCSQLEKASSAPLGLSAPAYFHPLICRCFAIRSGALRRHCAPRPATGTGPIPAAQDTSPAQSGAGRWDLTSHIRGPAQTLQRHRSEPGRLCHRAEGAKVLLRSRRNPPAPARLLVNHVKCENITKRLPFHATSSEDNARRLLITLLDQQDDAATPQRAEEVSGTNLILKCTSRPAPSPPAPHQLAMNTTTR